MYQESKIKEIDNMSTWWDVLCDFFEGSDAVFHDDILEVLEDITDFLLN